MNDDRFEKWFGRAVRIIMLTLGSAGFAFEVVSSHRTLWVGLLSVGLIAGNAAALVQALLEGGIKVRLDRSEKEK